MIAPTVPNACLLMGKRSLESRTTSLKIKRPKKGSRCRECRQTSSNCRTGWTWTRCRTRCRWHKWVKLVKSLPICSCRVNTWWQTQTCWTRFTLRAKHRTRIRTTLSSSSSLTNSTRWWCPLCNSQTRWEEWCKCPFRLASRSKNYRKTSNLYFRKNFKFGRWTWQTRQAKESRQPLKLWVTTSKFLLQ